MQQEHTKLTHAHRVSLALAAMMKKTPQVDSLLRQITGLENDLQRTKVSLAHMESKLDELELIHAQCPAQPNVTDDPHTGQGTDDAHGDQDTEDQNQGQGTDDAHGDQDTEDLHGGQGTEGSSGGQGAEDASEGQGTDNTTQEGVHRRQWYGKKHAHPSGGNYAVKLSDATNYMAGKDTQDPDPENVNG